MLAVHPRGGVGMNIHPRGGVGMNSVKKKENDFGGKESEKKKTE